MASFKTCPDCLAARTWATAQPEWGGDGEHLYCFGLLEENLSYLAPEINPGNGRRFKAYRLQVHLSRKRLAATDPQSGLTPSPPSAATRGMEHIYGN